VSDRSRQPQYPTRTTEMTTNASAIAFFMRIPLTYCQ
jgi:hypothetical protein